MRWRQLDRGVSAVSFGFVATAILVSMFLAMAILEHFLHPPTHTLGHAPPRGIRRQLRFFLGRGGERADAPGSDLEAARKLQGHAPLEVRLRDGAKASTPSEEDKSSYGENARRKPHTPSAIVIGGGFAGLAAADALRNASFQSIWEHLDEFHSFELSPCAQKFILKECIECFFSSFLLRRLLGVCEENPLAPIIGRLGLPLYRKSGDDSVSQKDLVRTSVS
uniref:Uncharacterized protein n=1 Tax=Zea mays TaxID=4577 RepID=A0A804PBL5_MAIZE